jgi:hypothetical protein
VRRIIVFSHQLRITIVSEPLAMKRRTVARVIALVILAYLTALVIVAADRDEMQKYHSLSHEALLAKLADVHDANFDTNFVGSFIVLGIIVACVNALTTAVEWTINRISPPPVEATTMDGVVNASQSHLG